MAPIAGAGNMVDFFLLEQLRNGHGDRIAIHTDEESWTYSQLAALVCDYIDRMAEVAPGERVVMAMADGPDYAAALLGIIARGAVAVMVNPEMTPVNLTAIFDSATAPCALVDERFRPLIERAISDGRSKTQVLGTTRSDLPRTLRIPATHPTKAEDPALWLFSGGTTGVPKIVVQRHRSFVNTTRLYAQDTMGYSADDITLAVPRLFFGYATGSALLFPLSVGAATVLFDEPPTPDAVTQRIRRHSPTILVTTPSAINAMLAIDSISKPDLASLRFATSAGEALPEALCNRWQERFGVELIDGLGTAEMWHIFITNRLGDVTPGTVGKAVDGFIVGARDEHGKEVPMGDTGLLWVKGDSAAIGYWEQPELTDQVFRDDWVVSGDLISIDDKGVVTHRGRADDAFKVKGKWLRPVEVESCLLEHSAVAEAAVIVVEDQYGLGKPVAFIVRKGEATEDDLREHVLAQLEAYKHPRRIFFVDSFPLTHLGKVDRTALKKLAAN